MQYHAQGKLPHPPHLMLRAAIESVWDNYDIIVIDSAPNLGTGTINVVCAADIIVVATLQSYLIIHPFCSSSPCFWTFLNR